MFPFRKLIKQKNINALTDINLPDVDYANIDNLPDKVDFIHNTCKEFLLNTISAKENIQKKIVLVLGFIWSLMSLVASRIINILLSNSIKLDSFNIAVIVTLAFIILEYAIISCFLTYRGFLPKQWTATGNEPKNLLVQKNLEQSITFMKIGETMDYQSRISHNILQNEQISHYLRRSILCLIFLPIVSSYIIFWTCHHFFC